MKKKFKIYPSLGIARLGNGPADKAQVNFSPEIPWDNMFAPDLEMHVQSGKFKGALKKQAQRFYIYECDEDGNPTQQLDLKKTGAEVEWSVEVANKKPFWYDFNNSLDLSVQVKNQNLSPKFFRKEIAPGISASARNPNVLKEHKGENFRKELVNSPAPVKVDEKERYKHIGGMFPFPEGGTDPSKSRIAAAMNTQSKHVNLGTIEYDHDPKDEKHVGTLIFYGADGLSASLNPSDLNTDFADNSNWYDDICDGRVTATVTIDGKQHHLNDAESAAWIATAPPDYAPQIQPLSSMYDLICGTANDQYKTDFSLVFPVFLRLYRMQWVNVGDFLNPSFREVIDRLSEDEFVQLGDNGDAAAAMRDKIFKLFRDPRYNYDNEPIIPSKNKTDLVNIGQGTEALKLPYYPGDGINYPGSPAQWFAIPPMLYEQLEKWRDGDFESMDLRGILEKDPEGSLMDRVARYYQAIFRKVAKNKPERAALLMTRAVAETLYGGGFHPGVELTWPFRHKQMYARNKLVHKKVHPDASFFGLREIRVGAATQEEQAEIFYKDFGFQINVADVHESMDPKHEKHWLWKLTPGDMTKWMGIPWQSDAGSCQKVFTDSQYPIPAWWAANLPVDVLTEESYQQLRDDKLSDEMKQFIYAYRTPWLNTADTGYVGYHAEGGYLNGLISMVYKWKDVGVVRARKLDVAGLPKLVYVAEEGNT